MEIKIITKKISRQELKQMAEQGYGHMIKAVVDIKKEIVALGGEFHSQTQELLTQQGSDAQDTWGANIFLDKKQGKQIKFTALINIRSSVNPQMEIKDSNIKEKVQRVIDKFIV